MEQNIRYIRVAVGYDEKPRLSVVTRTVKSLQAEAFHYNLKTAEDLVNRWNIFGKAMQKYVYYLLTPHNQQII